MTDAPDHRPDDYSVVVSRLTAEDGGGYLAQVPELPGCMGDGATPEEAMADVRLAIRTWIASAVEDGTHVPEPHVGAVPLQAAE